MQALRLTVGRRRLQPGDEGWQCISLDLLAQWPGSSAYGHRFRIFLMRLGHSFVSAQLGNRSRTLGFASSEFANCQSCQTWNLIGKYAS